MATTQPDATPSPVPPAVANGPKFMGHPAGLFLLFLVEMWERFSYYGMRTILVLYLTSPTSGMLNPPAGSPEGFNPGRGWADKAATNLSGWYSGMAYLLPIVGGIIADRFIGTHRSMLVGGVLIALGHVVLAVSGLGTMAQSDAGMSVFVFGLVLIIIGTGHFKPTISVMVGQLYEHGDARRDGAFSIFYMGINVGAMLQGFAVGYVGEKIGWHYGFGLAAIGMFAGLMLYLFMKPKLLPGIGEPSRPSGVKAGIFLPLGIGLAAAAAWLFHQGILNSIDEFLTNAWVSRVIALAAVAWMVSFVLKQRPEDRGPVASIFIFTLFNALFWLGFEQASTSINLFTQRNTDRNFMGTELATGFFQSVNPMFIVLFAPAFAGMWVWLGKRRMNPSQPVKIGLGLIFLGVGYLFMTWAGLYAKDGAKATMWLIIATYFWHTIGELFLSPTGLSYVTKAAPKQFVSLLMGVYFLSSFVANLIGGKVAGIVGDIESGAIKLPWSFGGQADFYFTFVVTSIAAGSLILLLTPLLKKLMRNPND